MEPYQILFFGLGAGILLVELYKKLSIGSAVAFAVFAIILFDILQKHFKILPKL